MEELSHISAFNHYFLTMVILITMVLVSRTIVAGTKYSSILVIVIFGLTMGALLVKSGIAAPGLSEFPAIVLVSQTTIIALIATFFVGGQEIRRILSKQEIDTEIFMTPSKEEVVLGTTSSLEGVMKISVSISCLDRIRLISCPPTKNVAIRAIIVV